MSFLKDVLKMLNIRGCNASRNCDTGKYRLLELPVSKRAELNTPAPECMCTIYTLVNYLC